MKFNLSNFIMIPYICMPGFKMTGLSDYIDIIRKEREREREREILICVIDLEWDWDNNLSNEILKEQLVTYLNKTQETDNLFFELEEKFKIENDESLNDILFQVDELKQIYNRNIQIIFGSWRLYQSLKDLVDAEMYCGFLSAVLSFTVTINEEEGVKDGNQRKVKFLRYSDDAIEDKFDWNLSSEETSIVEKFAEYILYLEKTQEISSSNTFKVFDDFYKCSLHWNKNRKLAKEMEAEFKEKHKNCSNYVHVIPISQVLYDMLIHCMLAFYPIEKEE